MKAIVLKEFGGPEALEWTDAPDPEPQAGEVVVKVRTVSVNITLDIVVRMGRYARGTDLPHVLGADPAGEIVAVGAGVEDRKVGDKVAVYPAMPCGNCRFCGAGREAECANDVILGVDRWGGYAQYVATPARNAFPIPDSMSFAHATVIMRHGPTARHLLHSLADLKPQETVLVMGAAGGLGMMGIQVAKLMGARVIAAAGSDERVATGLELGADCGVNYRSQDLTDNVMELTDGRGLDVVFENIGDPQLWPAALAGLGRGGRVVTAGAHGSRDGVVPLNVRQLYIKCQRIAAGPGANLADIQWALEMAAGGKLRAAKIDRIMPLREAAEAHRLLQARVPHGKVVLDTEIEETFFPDAKLE